ncbi:hypothetical protein AB0M02_36725 [Actinoplanes sp. NPDC051861]|uniref:hypothetical protein n=1 Tax=Actinoplanes sp. NPDC051861 TaxID=3155170 RepID=UPI0034216483
MVALLRGQHGSRLAQTTLTLTGLRLGAVLTALIAVTLTAGIAPAGIFGMAVAVGDALAGFVTTTITAHRTRNTSLDHRQS